MKIYIFIYCESCVVKEREREREKGREHKKHV